jgi:hypothetical protein
MSPQTLRAGGGGALSGGDANLRQKSPVCRHLRSTLRRSLRGVNAHAALHRAQLRELLLQRLGLLRRSSIRAGGGVRVERGPALFAPFHVPAEVAKDGAELCGQLGVNAR